MKDNFNDDKNPLDDQWQALSQDWQAQTYEKIDINALVNKTKRRTLLAKALLAFDILGTLSITLLFVYGLYQGDWQTPTLIYVGAGSLFSIIFVSITIKIRLAAWKIFEIEPEKIIETAIKGCQSSLQYIRLVKLSCYLIIPMVNWYVYEVVKLNGKSMFYPLIIANSFVILIYLLTHYFQRKRERDLKHLMNNPSE